MIDEFVEEIHAIRKEMMEQCGQDLRRLGDQIKRSQEEDPENLVTEVPPTEPEPATKTG
ncbi:MAG: hypothetical protein ABSG68_05580 [Thermoguttaceae bacterium]|jgi:hypothetical protein